MVKDLVHRVDEISLDQSQLRLGYSHIAAAVHHLGGQQQHSQNGQAALGEQVARHSSQLQMQERTLHMHGENFRFIAQVGARSLAPVCGTASKAWPVTQKSFQA